MVRRIHLHMDMDESEAAMIRNAARLVKLRPSYYVLNRILRVAGNCSRDWLQAV